MYSLILTESFKNDLKSSVKYIKQVFQAPVAAQRLKNEVKKAYKKIKEMPFIYPIVHDDYLASLGYRFVVIKNFMLFFKINENKIEVIRFLYGPSDWSNKIKENILPSKSGGLPVKKKRFKFKNGSKSFYIILKSLFPANIFIHNSTNKKSIIHFCLFVYMQDVYIISTIYCSIFKGTFKLSSFFA